VLKGLKMILGKNAKRSAFASLSKPKKASGVAAMKRAKKKRKNKR
jgi:hypothetical protein